MSWTNVIVVLQDNFQYLDRLQELITNGRFFRVVVDVATSALPLPLVALLVFGSIGSALYVVQTRVIIPFILFLLVGGITIARAPTAYGAGIIALLGLALAGFGYILLQRVRVK